MTSATSPRSTSCRWARDVIWCCCTRCFRTAPPSIASRRVCCRQRRVWLVNLPGFGTSAPAGPGLTDGRPHRPAIAAARPVRRFRAARQRLRRLRLGGAGRPARRAVRPSGPGRHRRRHSAARQGRLSHHGRKGREWRHGSRSRHRAAAMFPDDFPAAHPAIAEELKASLRAAKPEYFAAACRALAQFDRRAELGNDSQSHAGRGRPA